jgi:hypothetical protein
LAEGLPTNFPASEFGKQASMAESDTDSRYEGHGATVEGPDREDY